VCVWCVCSECGLMCMWCVCCVMEVLFGSPVNAIQLAGNDWGLPPSPGKNNPSSKGKSNSVHCYLLYSQGPT